MPQDDPNFDALMVQVQKNIDEYGWHIMAIFPTEEGGQYFCYTVGLWQNFHHPELVTFGLRPEVAHQFIRAIVDAHLRNGESYSDGQVVNNLTSNGYEVMFRSAPNNDPEWPTSVAKHYYGHLDYPVLQLVFPDAQHHWPWEPACSPKHAASQQVYVNHQDVGLVR